MKPQQFVIEQPFEVFEQGADRPDGFGRIVDTGHDRRADDQRNSASAEQPQIRNGPGVGHPRPPAMPAVVGQFQIAHPQTDQRQQLFDQLRRHGKVRLDGRRDPLGPAARQHFADKGGLEQRFAPGEGDPAARLLEIGHVAPQFPHQSVRRNLPSHKVHRPRRADRGAQPAGIAPFPVDADAALFRTQGPGPADRHAGPAGDTALRDPFELRLPPPGLGIVAPPAAEIAPFQKQRRPDARTVVNRHPLHLGDHARHCVLRHSFSYVLPSQFE